MTGTSDRCTVVLLRRYTFTVTSLWLSLYGLAGAGTGPDASLTAGRVLDKVRTAVGYDRLHAYAGVVELRGDADLYDVPGTGRFCFTRDGRFRLDFSGRFRQTFAFDGKKGWMLDWTGMPRPLELEQLETMQACAWVAMGHWLADEGPFSLCQVISARAHDRRRRYLWRA